MIQAFLQTLDPAGRFELPTFEARVGQLTSGMDPADSRTVAQALARMHAE